MEHKDFILKLEGGMLNSHMEFVAGFQELIDDGYVWNLHPMYGRTALQLLQSGDCLPASRLSMH